MPPVLIGEWNRYLDYELEMLTRAFLGAVPAMKQIGGADGGVTRLTKPEDIANFLEGLKK